MGIFNPAPRGQQTIGPKRRKRQRPGAVRSSLPPTHAPDPTPPANAPLPAPTAPGRAGEHTGMGGESSLADPIGRPGQQKKRKPRIGQGANPVRSATMNLLRR